MTRAGTPMTTARAGTSLVTTAPAAQDRSAQLQVRRVAPHRVVVGGEDARAEEDVVLDDAEAGHVDVGLDLDPRADDDVVVDGRAAPDDAVGTNRAALAHEGLIADDRPRADVRAGEDDRPGAHRSTVLDDEGVELRARRAGGRRQARRLAEHGVVLDDDAIADDD